MTLHLPLHRRECLLADEVLLRPPLSLGLRQGIVGSNDVEEHEMVAITMVEDLLSFRGLFSLRGRRQNDVLGEERGRRTFDHQIGIGLEFIDGDDRCAASRGQP